MKKPITRAAKTGTAEEVGPDEALGESLERNPDISAQTANNQGILFAITTLHTELSQVKAKIRNVTTASKYGEDWIQIFWDLLQTEVRHKAAFTPVQNLLRDKVGVRINSLLG